MAEAARKPGAMGRGARMLRTALGPAIAGFLEDPMIVEVMLNPDGRLWIDRLSEGLSDTGATLSSRRWRADRAARRPSCRGRGACRRARASRPNCPRTGERFEGLLPPVVTAPCFAIRKPAVAVFTLADYVAVRDHDRGPGAAVARRRRRAGQYPRGGRDLDRQDDADQCASGRSGRIVRPRRDHRGHARAAMHSAQPRRHAHQGRRRLALRSRPLLAPPAPRPHSHRRGARGRGTGPVEGLGHRPSRAGSAPSMRARPSAPCAGWSSSSRRPWSPCRAPSSPRPSISSPSSPGAGPTGISPNSPASTGWDRTATTASPRRRCRPGWSTDTGELLHDPKPSPAARAGRACRHLRQRHP